MRHRHRISCSVINFSKIMKIHVRNIANELEPTIGISGVNAIDVKIEGKIFQLPMTVPNKVELSYAETAHDIQKPELIQNVVRLYDIKNVRKTSMQNKIGMCLPHA